MCLAGSRVELECAHPHLALHLGLRAGRAWRDLGGAVPDPCCSAFAFWHELLTHMLCLSAFKHRAPCLLQSGCQQVACWPQKLSAWITLHGFCTLKLGTQAQTYLPASLPTHILCIPLAVIQILGLGIGPKPDFLQRITLFPSAKTPYSLPPFQVEHTLPSLSRLCALPLQYCHHVVTWVNWSCHSMALESSTASLTFRVMCISLRCKSRLFMMCPQLSYSAPTATTHFPPPSAALTHGLWTWPAFSLAPAFPRALPLPFPLCPHQCFFILPKWVLISSPLGSLSWPLCSPSSPKRSCTRPLQMSKSICQLSSVLQWIVMSSQARTRFFCGFSPVPCLRS